MDRTTPCRHGDGALSKPVMPKRRARAAPALLLGISALSFGCGLAPTTKVDRIRNYNTDLQTRFEASEARVAQLDRERAGLQRHVATLEDRIRGQEEVKALLEQRLDIAQRERQRLRTDLTGMVMRAAGETRSESASIVTVGAKSYLGAELPRSLTRRLTAFAEAFDFIEFDEVERVCRFGSEQMFIDNRDELRPEARAALRELASVLNGPDATALPLLVVGHSHGPGQAPRSMAAEFPTDWHLAAHQAIAVEQILEENRLAPKRMGVVSYGRYQPIVERDQPGADRLNARVEVFLLPADAYVE